MNTLHGVAFDHEPFDDPWTELTASHSLGWVTARVETDLVGFANVVWDGQVHAWLQDVIVAPAHQRRGIGLGLVRAATNGARGAGCEWLHVDFDDELEAFYIDAAGFEPTGAGLINLKHSG